MSAAPPPVLLPPYEERRRALWALVFSNFLMWGGFFLIIPLLSVHFVTGLGWSAVLVGTVLAVRQLAQQGLTVFGGALSDRLGPRGLILAGLVVRSLGFAAMGWATGFWTLLAASLLAGVGGALFDAPKNAATTALTREDERSRVFSVMGVAGNLGMVVGPLVGAFLIRFDFRLVAVVAGAIYLVTALVIAATLPALKPREAGGKTRGGLAGLAVAARDRRFVTFVALTSGFYLLTTQLNVAVTLRAGELGGADAAGLVYVVNAGLSVVLQFPLLRLASNFLSERRILVLGVLVAALGLGALAFAGTLTVLLACVALYSFGVMLAGPTQQSLTAGLARPGLYGAYFGFGALSLGVGGAVGNAIGGALYEAGRDWNTPALPWLVLGAIGLVAAAGLWWQFGREEAAESEGETEGVEGQAVAADD